MVVGLGGVPPPLSMICSPNKGVVLLPLSLKNPDPTDRGFDKQSRSRISKNIRPAFSFTD